MSDWSYVARNLRDARRNIRRAVERWAEIDPLEGHRVEAVRQIKAVAEEAERAVRALSEDEKGGDT